MVIKLHKITLHTTHLLPCHHCWINCFANGGVNMTWQGDKSVKIVAKKPLTERRSKYNCTMPSQQKSS
jgi:hypothetical protein